MLSEFWKYPLKLMFQLPKAFHKAALVHKYLNQVLGNSEASLQILVAHIWSQHVHHLSCCINFVRISGAQTCLINYQKFILTQILFSLYFFSSKMLIYFWILFSIFLNSFNFFSFWYLPMFFPWSFRNTLLSIILKAF